MPTQRSEPSASDRIQAGFDVLFTKLTEKTKKIIANLGSANGATSATDNAEWFQHVGFASRPSKPTRDGNKLDGPSTGRRAAQAVVIRMGDRDVVIASQDLRNLDIYGQLSDGETVIFATGEDGTAQARAILKADGSINLLTKKGNAADGAGVGLFIRPDGSITALGADGAAVILGDDGSLKVFNKSGALQITASGGIKLASKEKVDISAPAVTLGGPTAQPVAIAPAVLSALSTLQIEIASVATALVNMAKLPGPITPDHQAAAGAAATAVATASQALALVASEIPSKRTSTD